MRIDARSLLRTRNRNPDARELRVPGRYINIGIWRYIPDFLSRWRQDGDSWRETRELREHSFWTPICARTRWTPREEGSDIEKAVRREDRRRISERITQRFERSDGINKTVMADIVPGPRSSCDALGYLGHGEINYMFQMTEISPVTSKWLSWFKASLELRVLHLGFCTASSGAKRT
ncbi:hypothetical protein B0H17DRAFT_1147120 [Mycena rosella]|uniref:Uncharacterized protein n=1 Tax=Mycena rosella TaxID=1033263 RepID=A0AAD7CMG4_MYCRO|nr:hypothetical protein B0H17DRAFT_1147120 [Mycena rosella]